MVWYGTMSRTSGSSEETLCHVNTLHTKNPLERERERERFGAIHVHGLLLILIQLFIYKQGRIVLLSSRAKPGKAFSRSIGVVDFD